MKRPVSYKYYAIGIRARIPGIDVLVYGNKIYPWQIIKYGWYFDYIAALIKTHYPKCDVELSVSDHVDFETEDDYIAKKTRDLLKGKQAKLTQLNNIKNRTQPDLFGFAHQDIDDKIQKVKDDIRALENGTYQFYVPESYINNVKWFLSDEAKQRYKNALRVRELVQMRNDAVANDRIQEAETYWKEITELVGLPQRKHTK